MCTFIIDKHDTFLFFSENLNIYIPTVFTVIKWIIKISIFYSLMNELHLFGGDSGTLWLHSLPFLCLYASVSPLSSKESVKLFSSTKYISH